MNKKALTIIALILVAIIILPGAVLLGNPLESPEVYSLFLDWLSGKSMGLINFKVVTVDENGTQIPMVMDNDFTVYVHNFTYTLHRMPWSEEMNRRIESKLPSFTIKVWRLLDRYTGDWMVHEYTIVVTSRNYFGTGLIRVKPDKPIKDVEVKVIVGKRVQDMHEASTSQSSTMSEPPPPYETQWKTELTNGVQLHTITGVTASIKFRIGNYLYFSQKSRHIHWDPETGKIIVDYDWSISGDKETYCNNDVETASLSNGQKKWVKVNVDYKYERWPDATPYNYYELLTPISFGGWNWGEDISCSVCEGSISGNYREYPSSTPLPIEFSLGDGVRVIESFGASVSLAVNYGPITVQVEVWKEVSKGSNASPPAVKISSVSWQANRLYAFDANSQWKIVHFTWRQP
ncbi:MAG: hypothetical protein QXI87_01165 [Thermoproteota archaeon]